MTRLSSTRGVAVVVIAAALLAAACSASLSVPEAPSSVATGPGEVTTPESGTPTPDPTPDPLPGRGVTVATARSASDGENLPAAVAARLLSELGYVVNDPADAELLPAEAYPALASGELDYWINSWEPTHDKWIDAELNDGTTARENVETHGTVIPGGRTSGIVVTREWADEVGLRSWRQLNDTPELVEALDVDGNGKGDIFGCPPAWDCSTQIDSLLVAHGFDNLEQIKGGYAANLEGSVERLEAGLPVAQYTWSPSVHLALLRPGDNVVWLAMDEADVAEAADDPELDYTDTPAALGDACTADPCFTGWVTDDLRVVVNAEFAAANPVAVALLDQIVIDIADVATYMAAVRDGATSEEALAEFVDQWFEANAAVVDEWLAGARAAA